MKQITIEVLVVGGGATGTGLARDLAMRGFKTLLVERRDLAYGTTGRYHGLLHSGGRYVVKDPQAAKECIQENRTLRKIMPHCIEDTGGFFVLTPWDDPSYAARFLDGCQAAGVPVEELTIREMLGVEPSLNPQITRCFRVPDASADSFLTAALNAESARQYGAMILTYHETRQLLLNGNTVTGAMCHDLIKDEPVQIVADCVVNASGAWVGKVAATAGITIHMLPGKGTMVAVNHRIVNTVINRCKLPSDGDILVPTHTVSVMGTTDVKVSDPDSFGIEPWEIRLMLDEGEKIIPGFKSLRILRTWAGVRPLYQETDASTDRDVTRAFVLLDHVERDGIHGLVTITSGKWTTYRKMAEVTADKVCQKLDTVRSCRTHLEVLPAKVEFNRAGAPITRKVMAPQPSYHTLGSRLSEVEKQRAYGELICECELATSQDIENAIINGEAKTIDDIRRQVRLGMGPCQGGFCTYRVTGMIHALRHPPVIEVNASLRDFLQERWKGLLPVLWEQQLRQERFVQLIYQNVLNADHLPGPKASRLSADKYIQSESLAPEETKEEINFTQTMRSASAGCPVQVLVIGAGLAGLVAGWRAASAGKKTKVVAKGWGTPYWASGCIDVLGYYPTSELKPVESPRQGIQALVSANPEHPYAHAGLENIEQALQSLQALCAQAGYPLHGSLDHNWLLPTAMGAQRPTCLAPETMITGDLRQRTPMLVVGFNRFLDFFPTLVADNLNSQYIFASDVMLDLPILNERRLVTGMVLAHLFDTPEFCQQVIESLRPKLGSAGRVGFPPVLGLKDPCGVMRRLEAGLGLPVFEIPGLPPSIPGIRLHNILVSAIRQAGGTVMNGMQVVRSETKDGCLTSVSSEAASRLIAHPAGTFILATGGILGGGSLMSTSAQLQESIFNLPLSNPSELVPWLNEEFLTSQGHPLFRSGIRVNHLLQPINSDKKVIFPNLYVSGSALNACDPIPERSLEGVSLVTGYLAGTQAGERITS